MYFEPAFGNTGALPQPAFPTGIAGNLGFSCALSGNGEWLAVGMPNMPQNIDEEANFLPGAVLVYRYSHDKNACKPSSWTLIQFFVPGDTLTNSAGGAVQTLFGYQVGLSYTGDVLIVMGPGDEQLGTNAGSIWFYERRGMAFVEVQKLCPIVPGSQESYFGDGTSVFMDFTGDTIVVVGGEYTAVSSLLIVQRNKVSSDNNNNNNSRMWQQMPMAGQFAQILPSDEELYFNLPAISPCGLYVAVTLASAEELLNLSGMAWVLSPAQNVLVQGQTGQVVQSNYTKTDVQMLPLNSNGQLITPSGPHTSEQAATQVAISTGGEFLLMLGANQSSSSGPSTIYVYQLHRLAGTYTQVSTVENLPSGPYTSFAIDALAYTLVIGLANENSNTGQIQVYLRMKNSTAFQLVQTITDSNAMTSANQGYSIAVSEVVEETEGQASQAGQGQSGQASQAKTIVGQQETKASKGTTRPRRRQILSWGAPAIDGNNIGQQFVYIHYDHKGMEDCECDS